MGKGWEQTDWRMRALVCRRAHYSHSVDVGGDGCFCLAPKVFARVSYKCEQPSVGFDWFGASQQQTKKGKKQHACENRVCQAKLGCCDVADCSAKGVTPAISEPRPGAASGSCCCTRILSPRSLRDEDTPPPELEAPIV
jgi:hypothetical protein